MANTTHGYPYPVGTDRVMDGDDVIHNLATAVDIQLGVAASGVATVPTPTTGVVVTQTVNFPAGRFNVPPNVVATLEVANPQNWGPIGVGAITATGFNLNIYRVSGGTTTTPVRWIAHVI